MENYNPRQNTRMRWKDARELEKFKFITGDYDFDNEVLESASTDPLYKPLIDLIMESNNYNRQTKQFGIIVNDSPTAQFVYVGNINGYTIDMYAVGTNIISNVSMTYKPDTDTLTINYTEENLISEDNVKTFFGEQSIIGQGNIDLYRHDLVIEHTKTSYDDYAYKIYITYYSSNSLKVDSVQDLTAVTKATNGTKFVASVIENNTTGDEDYDTISQSYIGVGYNGSIWSIIDINGNLVTSIPINNVSDTVTTI